MDFKHILITGGAGFVGSNLAVMFKQTFDDVGVVALDNLKRRGSELNVPRLQAQGVQFVHGDVRCPEDLDSVPPFDLIIDCAAEPSVQAGLSGSPQYVLNNNVVGTIHCLEAARSRGAAFLLLSTSRVYPIARLNALPFDEDETRFRWSPAAAGAGCSERGIDESFPLDGARSYYGASKLCCELLLQEYAAAGMRALVNRCGILAGPWQMGKVDQGVITHWVARHMFQQPLKYIGFGGHGKQVRDVLHIEDLFDLIVRQLRSESGWNGSVFNVGGGPEVSTSLRELTSVCQTVTGRQIELNSVADTNAVDLRIYVSDTGKASRTYGWRPQRSVVDIVGDIHSWIVENDRQLRPVLA